MSIAASDYQSFSHAAFDAGARRALCEKLIIKSARNHTARLLRENREALARSSSGLVEMLSGWCHAEPTFAEAMGLPLALATLRDSEHDPVWIAALSAAHLHSLGREGKWHASFASPAPLAFGSKVTPPVRDVRVAANGGGVEISLDGSAAASPDALETTWPEGITVGAKRVPLLGPVTQATYPVQDNDAYAEVPHESVCHDLNEAVSILRQWAPSYLRWVEDALSAVVPIRPYDGTRTQSFSVQSLNGVVYASFPTAPLKVAELLVHETSHQYFHYSQFNTLFTNGLDRELYWSPYMQMDRPLDRILIAYHAFANIVQFYRECLATGMVTDRDLAEREIAFNLTHLGPMTRHLENSRGLSAAGRSLFEPLRDALYR
jgi:HEXXH motif-containing protein